MRLSLTALALAALFPLAVQAQSRVPPMQTQGDVKYVCGGIGSGASNAMRAAMRNHPLSLMFVNAQGEFLAAVAVTVKGDGGATVLSVPSSGGPICLIDLPNGRYSVTAEPQNHKAQTRSVTVGGGSRSLEFRF